MNIISVKYEDRFNPKTFGGKAYNYYTTVNVNIGDCVIAPTSNGEQIAIVTAINIPEESLGISATCLKTIEHKIDKEKYLYENTIIKMAA